MNGETAVMEDNSTDAMTNESMADHNDNAAMDDTPSEAMDTHNDNMAMQDTDMEAADDNMAEANMETMAEKPTWQTIALTNAQSGETFTLGDFAGKPCLSSRWPPGVPTAASSWATSRKSASSLAMM